MMSDKEYENIARECEEAISTMLEENKYEKVAVEAALCSILSKIFAQHETHVLKKTLEFFTKMSMLLHEHINKK